MSSLATLSLCETLLILSGVGTVIAGAVMWRLESYCLTIAMRLYPELIGVSRRRALKSVKQQLESDGARNADVQASWAKARSASRIFTALYVVCLLLLLCVWLTESGLL